MDGVTYSSIAVTSVGALSLIGLFFIQLREEVMHSFLLYLVSFASGAILGAAYFDLIPEAFELLGMERATDAPQILQPQA